mgnify:CR=1 FL=1
MKPHLKPGRHQAKEISDLAMLRAIQARNARGGPQPTEAFPGIPLKVIMAKCAKLRGRWWLESGGITAAGIAALEEGQ